MRAVSPVLSAGSRRMSSRTLRAPLRRSSASKIPEGETPVPVLLLQDMSLCYRLLRQLVPGLPPGRAASRVEILQHVIDYILDLQTELDASSPVGEEPDNSVIHRCQVFESREPLRSPAGDV